MATLSQLEDMLNGAETNEYRYEVAITAANYLANRNGAEDPIVTQLLRIGAVSHFMKTIESTRLAQEQWTRNRNELPFWKRLKVPHDMPDEYPDEWVLEQQTHALLDVSNFLEDYAKEQGWT